MKSILLSIKPRFVAKILNGEKTIEVRKTMPKCDLPIDVYIYCTKDNSNGYLYYSFGKTIFHDKYVLIKEYDKRCIIGNGKVVAKFTLNRVEEIEYLADDYCTKTYRQKELIRRCCLTDSELHNYLKHNVGYAWYISNLVIFDRPRELGEFKPYCDKGGCSSKCCYKHCKYYFEDNGEISYKSCTINEGTERLTKAPQSWQFIEVEGDK